MKNLAVMVLASTLTLGAAASPAAAPQPVDAAAGGPCAMAIADLQRAAAARGLVARATCRAAAAAEQVPFDASPVAAAEQPPLHAGRMTWPLRVRRPGAIAQVQQIPLTVDLQVRGWVVVRDLAAGETLREVDLVSREVAWTSGAATTTKPVGRLARSLRAGDAVSADHVIPPDTARRGDAVQIVLRQGPLELRVPGHLLAQARVGESARAQPLGRPAAISGVLTTLSTVESNVP